MIGYEDYRKQLTGLEVAVIGMALRFPGASDIDTFLENLKTGVDSVRFFNDKELAEAGIEPGVMNNPHYVKAKALIDKAEHFDAGFFGYTPAEAAIMDPQLRLFHQCTWHALEHAGYDPGTYDGLIGLYAGASLNQYWQMLSMLAGETTGLDSFSAYQLTNKDNLTTRVSYNLDLKGPSYAIQTACSTSLVAVHVACQSLLSGECNIALAGGVTITFPRISGYVYHEGMVSSPDGHCRAFDARARGTVGGEGCGVVALKLLEDALEDNDTIHAVIKGSAINNDGRSKTGYTAPSVRGQINVIKAALKMAEVDSSSIGYVEAHGTATALGDPIEVEALTRAFDTPQRQFCGLGSVKTNFGHLDSAAGIAGFMKTVLSLQEKLLFPNLYFHTANPQINFQDSPFFVPVQTMPWQTSQEPLRAGVSSFGIGGTNAHMILEAAPEFETENQLIERPFHLVLLSARSHGALTTSARNLAAYIAGHPRISPADVAYTLQVGRRAHPFRTTAIVDSLSETGSRWTETLEKRIGRVHSRPKVIFMFPGLGGQYVNMARDLYLHEAVFREELDRCLHIIHTLTKKDLKRLLYPSEQEQNIQQSWDHDIVQPLIFSIEFALARLLMAWGIQPYAMTGYSFGEYTAAAVSGVFSPEDALSVIVARGELVRRLPQGAMSSVPMSFHQLEPLVNEPECSGLSIAIDNGESCIISGPTEAVAAFEERMKKRRLLCMRLTGASHALHSPAMTPILDDFYSEMKKISLAAPEIPYISNVSGDWIDEQDAQDPGYWTRHLTSLVQFHQGICKLAAIPGALFVEVGPGGDLTAMIKRCLDETGKESSGAIHLIRNSARKDHDLRVLYNALGYLWRKGVAVDWNSFYGEQTPRRIPLPAYPFEESYYTPDPGGKLMKTIMSLGSQLLSHGSTQDVALEIPGGPGTGEETIRELKRGQARKPREQEEQDSEVSQERPLDIDTPYVSPGEPVQQILAAIWQNYFGFRSIGIKDDFFELGGDSLKAMNVSNLIAQELQVDIPVAEFFKHRTIEDLASYIDERGIREKGIVLAPVEEQEYYPLSAAQQRLFVLHRMAPEDTGYNETLAFVLEGKLDIPRFQDSLITLIQRHDSLRTSFPIVDGEPVQRIQDDVSFELELIEPGGPERLAEFVNRPFDLAVPPLLRVSLGDMNRDRYVVCIVTHHIISDGTSQVVFMQEWMALYNGEDLPPLRLQYKDYASLESRLLEARHIERQQAWWLERFSTGIPVLELPLDYTRPAMMEFSGHECRQTLDAAMTAGLNQLAAERQSTLFIVLLSAYAVLLSRLSSQEDIVIGTPVAGRRHAELSHVFGMFVNTLALRNYPSHDKSISELIIEVTTDTLLAFENQDFPFETLVDNLATHRDTSRNPLFDTMLVLQNMDSAAKDVPGLTLSPYTFEKHVSKFDLTLTVYEIGGHIEWVMEYRTRLFNEDTIQRFLEYYRRILSAFISEPQALIGDIDIIPDHEKDMLLNRFNDTHWDYPQEKTMDQCFAEQALRTPDRVAVVDSTHLHLSYNALEYFACDLAMKLRSSDLSPNSIIALKTERTADMIIQILAVWKSGAAYLPVDPAWPQERIDYVLKDSGAYLIKAITPQPDNQQYTSQDSERDSSDAAYIIYTSGSTGNPKGVIIQHRSAVNLALGFQQQIYAAYDKVLNNALLSPFFFDASVMHVWATLLNGHALYIVPQHLRADGAALTDFFTRYSLDIMEGAPGHLSLMLEASRSELALPGLKLLAVGGEALPGTLVNQFFNRFKGNIPDVMNLYGPTECTVAASAFLIDKNKPVQCTTIPIGAPLKNISIYILDRRMQLQPVGVTGELCIGGDCLGRGYLNNPELTASRFIHCNFQNINNKHALNSSHQRYNGGVGYVYRTGDLARWLTDGVIEFKGRIDNQVKIRGYRIEPGEIRHLLQQHEAVKEAVVTTRSGGTGQQEKYLCAYIVPQDAETFDGAKDIPVIKEYLTHRLPGYMIPAYLMHVASIPLTPQGKTDINALPKPGVQQTTGQYAAPRNRIESLLSAIWQEILDYSPVGIDDHFFEHGGHSLKATRLTAQIQQTCDVTVPLGQVFRCPTIRGLAVVIRELTGTNAPIIEPVEQREYYPCSPAQARLFILQQMDPQSTVYNISSALVLDGIPDIERIQHSFKQVISRHESLRTSFHLISGQPSQKIHQTVRFSIGPTAHVGPVETFIRPFDLTDAPLLRVELCDMDITGQHLLIVDMHHIISDGVSTDLLIADFIAAYSGKHLDSLELQYKDIAVWQRSANRRQQLNQQEQYWLDVFDNPKDVPVLQLPYDYPRPPVQDFRGNLFPFSLDKPAALALNQLAADYQVTLYMVLLALFNVLLSRLSNQEDIIIGTPAAGRTHAALEPIIGMFINTLAVRSRPQGSMPFSRYLEDIKTTTLNTFENQDYPFEELVEKVAVNRDARRSPLFDVMFVLQNMDIRDIQLPGMNIRPYSFDPGVARFDLTLTCTPSRDGLECVIEYCSGLFKPETIERFTSYFKRILQAVSREPGILLSQIPLMDSKERERLLFDFNDTAADYPEDKTIDRLFEEQAARTPDRTAVIGIINSAKTNSTYKIYETYYNLNLRADELAHKLKETGADSGDIVAIMMERSIDMTVNILAALKAGCAYMPIDPGYPDSRQQFMLKDSDAAICIDKKTIRTIRSPKANRNEVLPVQPSSAAYIIYTSGTTGQPKGTIVEHRNVVRLMFNSRFQFQFSESDRWTLFHSFCFDFSVWEMYGALLRGGGLVLVPGPVTRDPALFLDLLVRENVTVLNQTPASFYHLIAEALKSDAAALDLRYVIFGGDALKPALLKEWHQRYPFTKLINMYGITETTVHVTYKEIGTKEMASNISAIGQPIPTLMCYIVDRHLELQPLGVPGELLVSGSGVARGYLNRPELTATRFINYNFQNTYLSGDLARWLSYGEMEYLGRIDQQVKIRGFRVELGEIESQLLLCQTVSQAVVLFKKARNQQDAFLCAYVTLAAPVEKDNVAGELREFLSSRVPGYMVPSCIMIIERIPLTPNGKIDRSALPEPEFTAAGGGNTDRPLDNIEQRLAKIWTEVLEINPLQIGADSDFFALGGHSLKAIQAVNAIHGALHIRLPVQSLFQNPTLSALANDIREKETTAFRHISKQKDQPYYEMSYSQRRLWVLQRKNPQSPAFNMPESMSFPGKIDEALIAETLGVLIRRHDALRTCFRDVGGETVQWVEKAEDIEIPLETVDLSSLDAEGLERERFRLFAKERETPFNIEQASLLRVILLNCGAGGTDIIYNMHHLVSDGLSLEIFKSEFIRIYESLEHNQSPALEEPVLQYRDFAVWHNKLLNDRQQIEPVLTFWKDRMATKVEPLSLPYDNPLTADTRPLGAGYRTRIPGELTEGLRTLARKHQTTLFTVLLAAFNMLLYFLRGQEDVIVAFPGAARPHRDLDHVIGLFVNTLLLRTTIGRDESFDIFLEHMHEDVLRVLEYQDIPMELVFDLINVKYPDVKVFFNMQNTGESHSAELEAFESSHLEQLQDAKFPLVFYVMEFKNGMNLMCHYFKDLFEPVTIEKIVTQYLQLLEKIVTHPGQATGFYKTSRKRRKISRT